MVRNEEENSTQASWPNDNNKTSSDLNTKELSSSDSLDLFSVDHFGSSLSSINNSSIKVEEGESYAAHDSTASMNLKSL